MAVDKLIESDQVIQSLASSIDSGGISLKHVPGLLKRVLTEHMWAKRVLTIAAARTGEIVEFNRFEDFVVNAPPDGLGTDIKTIKQLCSDHIEVLDLIDQAVTGKPGPPMGSENATKLGKGTELNNDSVMFYSGRNSKNSEQGNSQSYALRRLRKQRPDLHKLILADELTCNQAMIEAGFRIKSITIPIHPARAARSILNHFTSEQVRELMEKLSCPNQS